METVIQKGNDFITEEVKQYIPEAINPWIEKTVVMQEWKLPAGAYHNQGGPV